MQLLYLIIAGLVLKICHAGDDGTDSDGDTSRKILGSSVVTSVSVVMDTANKKNAIFTDALGKPQSKPSNPSELASPIDLLNPDRYEFYTFDDHGDLVKRLMSLEEIRSIIATGDGDVLDLDSFTSQGFLPEKRVSDVVSNVQTVVKDEMEVLKDPIAKPLFDTPDVSDSWSMILPAVFGNSGEDIKPERPIGFVTPDTIMLEPPTSTTRRPSTKKPTPLSTPVYYSSSSPLLTTNQATEPALNVQIIANSEADSHRPQEAVESGTGWEQTEEPTRLPLPAATRPDLVRTSPTTEESRPTTKIQPSLVSVSLKPAPAATSVEPAASSTTLVSVRTSPAPTSTKKPTTEPVSTLKPVGNIFGFPASSEPSSRPTSSSPPPQRPINDIFGLPTSSSVLPPTPTHLVKTSTPSTTASTESLQLITMFKELLRQNGSATLMALGHPDPSDTIQDALSFESSKVPTTEQPTTTEGEVKLPLLLNALDEAQKLSASEMLNNLLWTTNIYEINTELAAAQLNGSQSAPDERFDGAAADSDHQTSTVVEDLLATTLLPSFTNETAGSTELSRQEDIDLTTGTTELESPTTTATSPPEDSTNLSSAVEQLLAQVNNSPVSLTNIMLTERSELELEEPTQSPTTTVKDPQLEQEATTYYYVVKTTQPKMPETTTLLQNRTKPAKADLSLEQQVIAEEIKNMSLLEGLQVSETTFSSATEELLPISTTSRQEQEETEGYSTELTTEEMATTEAAPVRPKPSIVITVNANNTVVTENGQLVANKSLVAAISTAAPNKNSTQNLSWTLVSTLAPQPPSTLPHPEAVAPTPVDLEAKPMQGFGLEESTAALDVDVHQFIQLCNELAFGFWKSVTTGLSAARSVFVSPFAATSMLAMVFLGAKGATSEEMNEILKLDDMVTFNPHLTFKGVTESVNSEPGSGVAITAIIRELFSDRSKGKLLDFYKNRVRAFYDGFVEEVGYREIGDVIRRRSNLLVKKYTNGKYPQFFGDASITARSPLSGISINIFETDCSQTSMGGRDGELHFIVFPSIKQRRLVPVPAVVYKSGFLAGYEPSLDATAVSIGGKDQVVSTILVIPGQQGIAAPGDGLARLEKRLVESSFKKGAWSRLLRSLIPRPGLEVQIPRFSHRSVINATNTLQRMGLHELFNPTTADLRGLNGVANELHLSDVLQVNKFATCGEKRADDTHHSEVYPATTMRARSARRLDYIPISDQDEPRDYQRAFPDPLHDPSLLTLPLSLRPRQARIPEVPRLRFDRPFLYFVRHNPTGLILHMGRFNPRLLP